MKKTASFLVVAVALLCANSVFANGTGLGDVSCVARPDVQSHNSFYAGNRAPLKPAAFIKLPLGNIQPQGWILKMLELQKDGLFGNLGEISAWLDKKIMRGLLPAAITGGKKFLIGCEAIPIYRY